MSTPEELTQEVVLPDTLDGHWDTAAGRDMAVDCLKQERSSLGMWDLTDMELANAQFLVMRDDLRLINHQTAAKERIRWLSAQFAAAKLRLAKKPEPDPAWAALFEAAKAMLPTNLALNNPNIGDDLVVPMDVSLGELRALSEALLAVEDLVESQPAPQQLSEYGANDMGYATGSAYQCFHCAANVPTNTAHNCAQKAEPQFERVFCDCTQATQCPNGKTGSADRCSIMRKVEQIQDATYEPAEEQQP